MLLLIPVTLFVISLFIWPVMSFDTAFGFLAFRGMLQGGSFNNVIAPDPQNIAHDIGTFLAWWSPGQYLVPGAFVWLGTDYGVAMSLTALIATVIGVLGWVHVARRFDVSCFVLFLFVFGLATFRYTLPFTFFIGGEVVLFAVSPWALSALQWAVKKRPAVSFAISALSFALFFFAKLSGLFIFAAIVAGISFVEVVNRRRLSPALLAIWAGAAVAAFSFLFLWLARGATPVTATKDTFMWPEILFPMAAAAFSGFSAPNCLEDLYILIWRLITHSPIPDLSAPTVMGYASYVLGPLGLLLMGWVWFRLRNTRYQPMAASLFPIVAFYVAGYVVMYFHSNTVPFEERYFYFVGILFFLLLLVAMDQWRGLLARAIPILTVGMFAAYGLTASAHEMMRKHHYDRASGTAMLAVSPVVLEYLRSEMAAHNWEHAIAAIPQPEAANGLPHYRILFSFDFQEYTSLAEIERQRWAGRTDKIFVVLNQAMLGDGKAEAVLKDFVDYDIAKWDQVKMDGMVVFSQ
jgi:hypothetical protein